MSTSSLAFDIVQFFLSLNHYLLTLILGKAGFVLQISYSLVVILELSDVLEVQYKEIIMSSINKNN